MATFLEQQDRTLECRKQGFRKVLAVQADILRDGSQMTWYNSGGILASQKKDYPLE
jgi:hypothetical protein